MFEHPINVGMPRTTGRAALALLMAWVATLREVAIAEERRLGRDTAEIAMIRGWANDFEGLATYFAIALGIEPLRKKWDPTSWPETLHPMPGPLEG